MLKIKDNVDVKELEKFSFKPRYDEDTGNIVSYIKYVDKFEEIRVVKRKIFRIFKAPSKKLNGEYNLTLNILTLIHYMT